ncbi:MAG: MATE family efflux transporter [Acutalibacter muris]|nr:MATE family efflux transporter [Acutalibacter muris]
MQFIKKFIGTKAFYLSVIVLLVPMVIQQGITQFVNLLDNVMVGRLGTEPMSGVAIVNQIIFIFNLTIFGGMSGASIFGAQYYGKGDLEGLRHTLRFRLIFAFAIGVLGILALIFFGESFFMLFLNGEANTPEETAATLAHAQSYMRIMLWGLLPFAVSNCFASVLKDTGETFIPMVASVISIAVNLVLNYLLIFGSFGFPKMGVAGAALATVIARYIEMGYLIMETLRHKKKFPFVQGAFRSLRVPLPLVRRIVITGTPLMLNESLWSMGISMISACYATRGLAAVAASNINSTAFNLFSMLLMSMGNAVAIMCGQQLGANDIEGAKDTVRKLTAFGVAMNVVMGLLLISSSGVIPMIYNTEENVRQLAAQMLIISGAFLPLGALTNCSYFAIRSGGRTFITFLFDCAYTWVVCLPVAFLLSRFTTLSLPWLFLLVQCVDSGLKAVISVIMLKSGIWAKNVVNA